MHKCVFILGRKVRVHHLRNGKELKQIVYDNHYDFNFQVCALWLWKKKIGKEKLAQLIIVIAFTGVAAPSP